MISRTPWAAAIASFLLVVACGDDDPVPIDEIPEDTRLVDLSGPEMDGICQWAASVSRQRLPAGTNCGGVPIMFSGCMQVPAQCPATVGQWKACVPALLDRFADDPCQVLDFAFQPSSFSSFIEETEGCMGLGPCGTVMQ